VIEKSLDAAVPLQPAFTEGKDSAPAGHYIGQRDGLRITINWAAIVANRQRAVIQEIKVSETLIEFFAELHRTLGADALNKAATLRVSRGPIITQHPAKDYVNRSNGSLYTHHPIPGTSFYVITHSSTPEKIAAIQEVARILGIPPGTISVERT
jgi:hypothetical protein